MIDVINTPNQDIDVAENPLQEIAVEQAVAINVLPAPDVGSGENGATFIPSVSEDGVISWTNDKDLPNPEPVNIKGGNGKDGNTPYIQNGYWYIDSVNTDVKAEGVKVIRVEESDISGGTTAVTFSDGAVINIKNGKDYVLTDADKAEMVQSVINALPKYNGEVVAE